MHTPADRHEGRRAPILSSLSPGTLADRLGVSAAAVVLGALAVVAAAVGGWWALRPPAGPDPAEILPMAGSVPIPTPAPPTSSAPEPARMVVDVVGAVVRPGVHELPAGSRVTDAIDAAGGFTAGADRIRLNLAQPVADGSRVWVPAIGESTGPDLVPVIGGSGGTGVAEGGRESRSGTVDINTANAASLESLPGIGPSLAAAIVEHRQRHGPFAAVDDLIDVSGIGPAKLEQIRPRATAAGP
ncbi:MAG: ComEA family DNA-binding protein [Acidimicrobiaceae bacterium]|nr:ComEA family DNA-binding protein [Acidimicrobiaceae bacterium]